MKLSICLTFSQWTEGRFFQSAHTIGMNFDIDGIQTHIVYLYSGNTKLLQM